MRIREKQMWRTMPLWMVRYWVSSWLFSLALWIAPNPYYSDELRRRVHGLRNEAVAKVLMARAVRGEALD